MDLTDVRKLVDDLNKNFVDFDDLDLDYSTAVDDSDLSDSDD